jgi:hypothetical protein
LKIFSAYPQDKPVTGSPFKVRCILLTDAGKSVAAGEGLVSARPDKEAAFDVIAHNKKGVRQRIGGDPFKVKFFGGKRGMTGGWGGQRVAPGPGIMVGL